MAKCMVKCSLCGEKFDRNSEPWEKTDARRYAHKKCYDEIAVASGQTPEDLAQLREYILQLFGWEKVPQIVEMKINEYVINYKYTYRQILLALKYHYEVKSGDISKAKGNISIVPMVMNDAIKYNFDVMKARASAANSVAKPLPTYGVREIRIKVPKRSPMGEDNPFDFLNEGVIVNE